MDAVLHYSGYPINRCLTLHDDFAVLFICFIILCLELSQLTC